MSANVTSQNSTTTTNNLTHIAHVPTCPYDSLVNFGIKLGRFHAVHPGVRFSWSEAEYADPDDANAQIDNVTIFEFDPNWSIFLIEFDDQAGYNAYKSFRP